MILYRHILAVILLICGTILYLMTGPLGLLMLLTIYLGMLLLLKLSDPDDRLLNKVVYKVKK